MDAEVLRAFVAVQPADVRLLLLDWQHPASWLWPHRQATSLQPPPVPVFPDGDYFAWLPGATGVPMTSYPCPFCGCRTLPDPPQGSDEQWRQAGYPPDPRRRARRADER